MLVPRAWHYKHFSPQNNCACTTESRHDAIEPFQTRQVLRGPSGEEAYTGLRTPLNKKYDFRSFFIVGDRERLFRRIELR